MKKMKKFLALFLAGLLSVALVGCACNGSGGNGTSFSGSENSSSSSETQPLEWNESTQERVFIADFENYNDDLNIIRIMRSFGKITRNKDANYAHSGGYSAKIQPLGGVFMYSNPLMYFVTQSTRYAFDYSDFSKVDYVSMWMYNDTEAEQTVKVGLVTKINNYESVDCTSGDAFKLEPKTWTDITYYVDFNAMNVAGDISEYQTKIIKGIYLEFNNAGSLDVADAPVFYLDDVSIGYKEETSPVTDPVTFDENEICDFEKLYQKYVFTYSSTSAKCIPDIDVVKASDYAISATSGSYALKMVMHAGDPDGGSWPNLVLPEKVLQKTAMKDIPKEEYGKTSFCFDIYNDTDETMTLYFKFYSANKQNKCTFKLDIPSKQWITFRRTLEEIGSNLNTDSVAAQKTYKEGLRVSDPGLFEISWREYGAKEGESGDKVFYFDNFRLVKEA
jgi:hypothetical protein